MEPLSVALHAIRKANISKDNSIAIIGTGTIAIAISQIHQCVQDIIELE